MNLFLDVVLPVQIAVLAVATLVVSYMLAPAYVTAVAATTAVLAVGKAVDAMIEYHRQTKEGKPHDA